ncbi:hypothetical protein [Limosilactobacillus sp.]|jgi:hypothetical protein|uniref:hypothetical protein n=1 Tax=Limosilactobacillus sp. TaxID=2773925 RepID=UPI0025B7B673|nr:hypothetical protein [Limosilactobacillus sp.]MCH3923208.1 hypothetical protein [Limosilactobacillus sp.]MCH3927890.1 hypothetical protein [Limosilactobacillus sp.]
MRKKQIRRVLILSVLFMLMLPAGALADVSTNDASGAVTASVTAQPVTPSTDLSPAGQAVSRLAPSASTRLAATGLGAVDQTITPDRGLFNSNSNVVSSEQQLPTTFTPGIIQYDQQNDHSEKINGQLTTQQMQTLNDYSNRWMNSLRHIWQSSPSQYSYHGQAYQAPNDLVTPPALFNAISEMAVDRTRVNYGYDHTGDERTVLNAAGNTAYGQYIVQADLTPSEEVVRSVAPDATGTGFTVGENLFKLSGSTMLEAEVNLFNRMEDMLWGEATDLNGKLEGANEHLANALNPLFTHVAMGFQLVSPNHWYVTWDFEGLDNVNHQTGQEYFSDADRIAINRIWDAVLMGETVERPATVNKDQKASTTGRNQVVAKQGSMVQKNNDIKSPEYSLVSPFQASKILPAGTDTRIIGSKSHEDNKRLPQTGNDHHALLGWIILASGISAFGSLSLICKPDKKYNA